MDTKILIASASEKSSSALAQLLKRYTWNNLDFASNGAEVRRAVLRYPYSVIIINAPLNDEQGNKLAVDLVHSTRSSVVLLAKSDIAEVLASNVEGEGVFVVPKPIAPRQFISALRLSVAFNQRLQKMDAEILKKEKKYEELRTVSRAKCILIEKEHLTEQEAHKFIERQAMNKRESKLQISTGIIKRYL